jgi:hypothetical protein
MSRERDTAQMSTFGYRGASTFFAEPGGRSLCSKRALPSVATASRSGAWMAGQPDTHGLGVLDRAQGVDEEQPLTRPVL